MSTAVAREVIAQVSVETGVAVDLIIGENRRPKTARARHIVCQRLRERGYSLSKIGKLMQRHHTTILHSLRVDVGGKS